MRAVTIDEIMDYDPGNGYTREMFEHLFNGRPAVPVVEILDFDIDAADRLWLALQDGLLDREDLYLLAAAFAEARVGIWAEMYPDDRRPQRAIRAARLYAMGEISVDELSAARADAWAAMSNYNAAMSAARSAWNASRASAWEAACNAAWAAGYDACCADGKAVEDAEHVRQLAIVRQYLIQKGLEDGDHV